MKKHFLLLIMAFMSMTAWAADLVGSQFTIGNVTYSEEENPRLVSDGTYEEADYTIDLTKWYTDEACTTQAKDAATGTPYTISTLPVGKYWVKITGMGTYAGLTASSSFNVIAIAATIEFTAGQKKAWKADDPATFAYSLTKKGAEWTDADAATKLGLTVGRVAGEDVATYNYTFNWTNKNYALTRPADNEAVKFAITAKDLSTTATITAAKASVVYTGKNAVGMYTVKDGTTTLVEGTDYTVGKAGEDVKNVNATITPTIVFAGNYTGEKLAGTSFAITEAPITVTLKENLSVAYNNADQADQSANTKVAFEYSGFVGDDVANAATLKTKFDVTAATVTVAGEAIVPGNYTLDIDGIDDDDVALANYAITTYLPATLTITPAELKIKAKNASKKVGAADPTTFALTSSTTPYGDKINGVTFTREKAGTAEGEVVGSYNIIPNIAGVTITRGAAETDVKAYYNVSVDEAYGQLEIKKGGIIVVIKDAQKFYGQADPEFTYAVYGLDEGDEIAAPVISREKAGTAAGEAVASYALTAEAPANPDAAKYDGVTVTPGVFTINKAELEFKMATLSIAKGADAAAQTAALKKSLVTVSGINNSEKADDLFALAYKEGISFADDASVADGYVATLTAAAQNCYKIIKVDGAAVADATKATGKVIVGAGAGAGHTLGLEDNADAAAQIIASAGETFDQVTIKFAARNAHRGYSATVTETYPWIAEKWTTMVLPFDISVADLSKALGYAIVNVINPEKSVVSGTGSKFYGMLTMKGGNGKDDVLAANKPFMLKLAEDINPAETYKFGKRTIVAPSALSVDADADKTVKFTGTYTAKTVTKADNAAIWFMNGNEDGWQYIGATSSASWTIAPFEAFIDMSAVPAAARNMTFFFEEKDGSVTAIKGVSVDSRKTMSPEGWYNLNGVKLDGAPTKKGIYIQNGKKVVIK